ncbi:MAG: ABC-F family ATP-binding cassette domain-containing protein [Bacteroidaceae bacterium]|nr:ABC-F family ATP-binding cassette domain-containing protein [Bacteroidaceae bacterium]
MLSVESLGVEFSARPLFRDVSFIINPKDRIALVGKNGAGKSTLLKILAGIQNPTYGTVARKKNIEIGYLPQVMVLEDECTVLQETEKAFANVHELKKEIDVLNNQLSERTDYDSQPYMDLVEEFTQKSEHFQLIGGLNYHAEMERTLQGLGFSTADFNRPTKEFSGGWRMRIELAKILLKRPDVLLLDEPTNHLDIESIRWLEQFLTHSNGAVVLVSHDRAFINNATNRTLEIACGRATDYKVKYDEFVVLRKERREQQIRAYENQQKEIADIKDFIERFRYKPTKAVQVQSRIKYLEKIVPIEIDEEDHAMLHLKFPPCLRSGDYPIICDEVSKHYGRQCVFEHVNLTIKRGEKVAFVGKNGEGKSTLIKCIMQEIEHGGVLTIGHNISIGYCAQNQAQLLDENLTVFDTIDRIAKGDVRLKIRDILGAFMFGGEAADKQVKFLSGGERSRLAMIKLLLEPVNFLILDEPTNHLDLRTKDILKQAIDAFDGTVIIVSHDREFLDGLVSKVYEFKGGKVREHIGGIYDFLAKIEAEAQVVTNLSTSPTQTADVKSASKTPQASVGKLNYEQQKEQAKLIKKAQRKVEELEQSIEKIENEIKTVEAQMATPEGSSDMQLFARYAQLKSSLDEVVVQWENSLEELSSIEGV